MTDFFVTFFTSLGFLWACFLAGYFVFGPNDLPDEEPSDV